MLGEARNDTFMVSDVSVAGVAGLAVAKGSVTFTEVDADWVEPSASAAVTDGLWAPNDSPGATVMAYVSVPVPLTEKSADVSVTPEEALVTCGSTTVAPSYLALPGT